MRDVGATGALALDGNLPMKLEAGLFNGSGLTQQKEWHSFERFVEERWKILLHVLCVFYVVRVL